MLVALVADPGHRRFHLERDEDPSDQPLLQRQAADLFEHAIDEAVTPAAVDERPPRGALGGVAQDVTEPVIRRDPHREERRKPVVDHPVIEADEPLVDHLHDQGRRERLGHRRDPEQVIDRSLARLASTSAWPHSS